MRCGRAWERARRAVPRWPSRPKCLFPCARRARRQVGSGIPLCVPGPCWHWSNSSRRGAYVVLSADDEQVLHGIVCLCVIKIFCHHKASQAYLVLSLSWLVILFGRECYLETKIQKVDCVHFCWGVLDLSKDRARKYMYICIYTYTFIYFLH